MGGVRTEPVPCPVSVLLFTRGISIVSFYNLMNLTRKFSQTLLLGGTFMLASLGAWAQKGDIKLKVVDGYTGFVIPNAEVQVIGSTGKKAPVASQKGGRLMLKGAEGTYTFRVSAPGYDPIETHYSAEEKPITVDVMMDRLQQPDLDPQRTRMPALAATQTLIKGYISDRETGTPLPGVTVRMGSASAVSDSNGYYEFILTSKGPEPEEFVKEKTNVTFSKDGYVSYQKQGFRVIGDSYIFRNSLQPAAQTLGNQGKTSGPAPMETQVSRQGFFDKTSDESATPEKDHHEAEVAPPASTPQNASRTARAAPATIRVGTGCSCNNCGSYVTMSLETYVSQGINDEWIMSWNAASIRAGTIAYRTYGAYHVGRGLFTNYDISSTTCRQVWDSDTDAEGKAVAAAAATRGLIMLKNGAIAFTEYSSENNNAGCGNGRAGLGTAAAPCISDPLCSGRAKFGHGRGMCQYGTSFWATNGKTHLWMIDHYYTPYGFVLNTTTNPTPPDTQAPTTSITGPASATTNFTATFADNDNTNVTERFYQSLEWRTNEWRANRGNGFYNDNFGNGALHPDYVQGAADWQGTWAETSTGKLQQSNVTLTNTALSTTLSQTAGNTYLYNFAAKVNNTTGTRRFGIHIMASSATVRERGNSYLIWFALDQQKVSIIETIDNVINLRVSNDATLTSGTWSDYKVMYKTSTGDITVYQNNRLVASWKDTTPLTSGANISLRTSEANVEFDDLKVFKGRAGTTATITVGAANSNDIRTSASPGAKIKSLVKDAANNWSELGNLDVNITIPAARTSESDSFSATLYPNPVGSKDVTLQYNLEQDAPVTIEIYDSYGKKLKQIASNEVAGAHKLVVPVALLKRKGVYFVRLSADNQHQTIRLVKE